MASEQDYVDALREAAQELGASPTKAEYEELGLTPATIIRTVGGWNDAKARAGLATNASTGPPEGVDDEIRERWAELSVDRRWHYRNREWNTERTLIRRAEFQSWVDERSADAGCARCNDSDPACLDFHHRDPDEKSRSVSRLIVDGVSRERLREEMEKCTVLCANCHWEGTRRRAVIDSETLIPPNGLRGIAEKSPSSETVADMSVHWGSGQS